MARKFATHVNLQKNELQNAVIQVLASDPSSPSEGQIYYNSTAKKLRQFNGTVWLEYGVGSGETVSTIGTLISGATAKTTPVDADSLGISDSAASNVLKKLTFTNLKAFLKTYFDTLYATISHTHTASNVTDFDTQVRTSRLDQMAAPTASVSANSQKITNLATPTVGGDAANKTYVDGVLAANDAMVFKGGLDASTNPNYPAANAGETYKITVAGKVGGASGIDVQVGDTIYCTADSTASGNQATVGASWTIVQANVDRATSSTLGLAEYATQAEAEAKSDATVAVTPAALANFTQKKTFTKGDASSTSIACAHNLGTTDVAVAVYEASGGAEIECDITHTDSNTVTLGFTVAPALNAIKVVVVG